MVYEGVVMVVLTGAAIGGIAQGIGALGSAGLGAFSANASSKKQFKYQSALQAQAAKLNYDYSLLSARNTPSATREGLENAGYNPMLAVQNSTSGANSSWTSSGQSSAPDYNAGITQGVANAQSFQRLKNETDVAVSTEDMNYANADKAKAEANESVLRSKFIPDKEKSIIAKQNAEAKKLENDIHIAEEQIKLGQMGITVQQQANANQAEYNRILERNNKRSLRTQRTRINGPFGIGWHAGSYNDQSQGWYDR